MTFGSLAVDLASLVIVLSVLALAVAQTTPPSSGQRILLSDNLTAGGYYGPDPFEAEDTDLEIRMPS